MRAFASLLLGVLGTAFGHHSVHGAAAEGIPTGYQLVYEESFDHGATLDGFQLSDRAAWKITSEANNAGLELVAQSKYEPPVRSPFNIALIKDKVLRDFILEADLMQTGKEYGHRDMCIFFGFQAANKFYYTHLATAADDHAHNIFIVNSQPRTKIAEQTTRGVNWGLNIWHKVRLERKVADGSIRVYFDHLDTPIMVAHDTTLDSGFVGFGSFDDTGRVDNVRIWAPSVETKAVQLFPKGKP